MVRIRRSIGKSRLLTLVERTLELRLFLSFGMRSIGSMKSFKTHVITVPSSVVDVDVVAVVVVACCEGC